MPYSCLLLVLYKAAKIAGHGGAIFIILHLYLIGKKLLYVSVHAHVHSGPSSLHLILRHFYHSLDNNRCQDQKLCMLLATLATVGKHKSNEDWSSCMGHRIIG